MSRVGGFVKFHRRIFDWDWYGKPNTVALWFHLVMKANYTNSAWRGIPIARGQLLTSTKKLSKETGLSVQTVRTNLANLERTGEIMRESTNQYTLITICKYDDYQSSVESVNQVINEGIGEGSNSQTKSFLTTNKNRINKDFEESKTLSRASESECKKVIDLYHRCCPSLVPVMIFNNSRRLELIEKTLKAMNDAGVDVEEVFSKAEESPFLCGENPNGFRGSFDFVMKNWVQIYEDNYTVWDCYD